MVILLLMAAPLEKKLARAATTPAVLFVSSLETIGAGWTWVSAESALSKLSKLESTFSVSGERVTPWYWPTRLWAKEVDGGREAETVTAGGFEPLPMPPSLFGRIGIGREISTLTPLLRAAGSSEGTRLLEFLLFHQLMGQNNRPRNGIRRDGEEVVELLELLGGWVKSGLQRVL